MADLKDYLCEKWALTHLGVELVHDNVKLVIEHMMCEAGLTDEHRLGAGFFQAATPELRE